MYIHIYVGMDTPRSMLLDVCIHYIYIFVFYAQNKCRRTYLWSLQLVDMHSFRGAGYSPAASGNERGGHNISGVRRLMRVASEGGLMLDFMQKRGCEAHHAAFQHALRSGYLGIQWLYSSVFSGC